MARFTEKQRLQIKKDRERKRKSGNKNASVRNVYSYHDGNRKVPETISQERINDGDPTVSDLHLHWKKEGIGLTHKPKSIKRKNPKAAYPNKDGKHTTEVSSTVGKRVAKKHKKWAENKRKRVLKKIREFE